jgi:16S rRNA (uracil1498-N3)-methyltransferase
MEYEACINGMDKLGVELVLLNARASQTEPKVKVALYQAWPKAGKMETITQKCVELGIHAIYPVLSARSVSRPDDFSAKRARLNRIAYEAAKQSQRGIIPEVHALEELSSVSFEGYELVLLAYEEEKVASRKSVIRGRQIKSAAVIIGPEGGFTPEEAAALQEKGAVSVSLGNRILRTETAGMAVLSMLLYEWEA